MKNIYLIPTDKPSSLGYDGNKTLHLTNMFIDDYVNIYITSNEEIKEGDWYFDGTDLVHKKTKYNDTLVDGHKDAKKIILTTDQDLIKEGVQAIPDDFLEWFVKNPSCERVEIFEQYRKCCRNTDGTNEDCIEPINCEGWLNSDYERPYKTNCDERFEGYKIIIPKEEKSFKHKARILSKEEIMANRSSAYEFIDFNKQETLEEAAKNLYPDNKSFLSKFQDIERKAFIQGAKWQLNQILDSDIDDWLDYRINTLNKISFKEWFEQFKKE